MGLSCHQSRKNALTSGNLAQFLSDNSFRHEIYNGLIYSWGRRKKRLCMVGLVKIFNFKIKTCSVGFGI